MEPYERRRRTRNQKVPECLSPIALKNALKDANIGLRIEVNWSLMPDPERRTDLGTIVSKIGSGWLVSYDDPDLGTLPLPNTNENVLIYKIVILGKALLNKPITMCNRPINNMAATIFCDGGARPSSGGPGASAIVTVTVNPLTLATNNEVTDAKFLPRTTVSIAEGIALDAGLTKAARMIADGTPHVNIVVDSEMAYMITLGMKTARDKKIVEIFASVREKFVRIAGQITLAHMNRDFGNLADKPATDAILLQQSSGDQSLFMEPPVLPAPAARKQVAPTMVHDNTTTLADENMQHERFIDLRRFRSRTRVPESIVPQWSTLVSMQLSKFTNATTTIEREREIVNFLALPTLFLPQSASTKRITKHLTTATPFHLDRRSATRQEREAHRMAEQVQRYVSDRKLRTANKLVKTAATTDELSFEEKTSRLREKFVGVPFTSNIPMENIPLISADEVTQTLQKMSTQAATAIDGWTPTLLLQAIHHDYKIASMVGCMLTTILTQPLSKDFEEKLLLGRAVAIPKALTDVRPIVVSALLINMMGTISVKRDDRKTCSGQYAIGVQQGCQRIIHKIRKLRRLGKAIIKADISNAFGAVLRAYAEAQMEGSDTTMRQFFRVVYGGSSKLAIFGPDGKTAFIDFMNGVKQGDAASSYIFCHCIDPILQAIAERAQIPIAQIFAYMDDITIAVDPENAAHVAQIIVEEFAKIGMKVNVTKSEILSSHPIPNSPFPVVIDNGINVFNLLGACISKNTKSHVEEQIRKQDAYFKLISNLPLHPHIKFVLLRTCASPRITYYCSVMDPADTKPLTDFFQRRLIEEFSALIDPTGQTLITPESLTSRLGVGVPDLSFFSKELFAATRQMALEGQDAPPQVKLVHTEPRTAHEGQQVDAQWLFYAPESYRQLTPAQFSTALAIRLNIIPPHLRVTGRCSCGEMVTDSNQYDHVLRCDLATGHGHPTRHNRIRDAIIRYARENGITCQAEPRMYIYADGKRHRPDIAFYIGGQVTTTTDLTVVALKAGAQPGSAAQHADEAKTNEHKTATAALGHDFIPCAIETHGYLGKGALKLFKRLSLQVIPSLQKSFVCELTHIVATTMAATRADALASAVNRQNWLF